MILPFKDYRAQHTPQRLRIKSNGLLASVSAAGLASTASVKLNLNPDVLRSMVSVDMMHFNLRGTGWPWSSGMDFAGGSLRPRSEFRRSARRWFGLACLLALGLPALAAAATLTQALDAPGLTWTSTQPSGGGPWTAVTTTTHDGVDAARSGTPPYGGLAQLATTLSGPGTVVFWAKAQTPGGSYLLAEIEGGSSHYIQNSDWRAYTLDVPAGTRTLLFRYVNLDYFGTAGDAAWVDEVSFANYSGQRPAFVWLPPSNTAGDGDSLVWSLALVGELPFDIVWQHGGTNRFVFPQVNQSFQTFGFVAQPDLAGEWRVSVSNRRGTTNSAPFTLTVTSTPPRAVEIENSFSSTDNPLTVAAGAALTLTARAAGTAPLAYQWRRHGANLLGQTSSNLVFASFSAVDEGDYSCRVTNALGAALSGAVTLQFDSAPPVILDPPQGQTLEVGQALELSVMADGALPLGIEWFKDGAALTAETGPLLYRWFVTEDDTGVYRVRVFNPNGEVWSPPVTVSVAGGIPLGDALEAATRPWSSGNGCDAGPGWRGEASVTHDGTDAAGSVPLSADAECVLALQTEVVGPVLLEFWWKLEGAAADELYVEVLDSAFEIVSALSRSGGAGSQWVPVALQVPSGSHTVRWRLISGNGSDGVRPRAWVDELSGQSLADALDTPGLAWTTESTDPVSGNPADGWFYQTGTSSDGEDAAQSPDLNEFGRSFVETTVQGPVVLQARAAVRGDPDARLEFAMDGQPVPYGVLDGTPGSPEFSSSEFLVPSGIHVIRWELFAGEQWDGPARAWLDQVRRVPSRADLTRALDNPELPWLGPGWTEASGDLFTGSSAAKSPPLPDAAAASLDTVVVGPAEIEFDWLVDAAQGDYLRFYVDDQLHSEITGYSGYPWQSVTASIGPGLHFLRWLYVKDGSGAAGADAGWVDNVRLFPVRTPIVVSAPADVTAWEGDVAGFSVTATSSEPMAFQWYHEGVLIADATADTLVIDPVALTDAGGYFVVVGNSFGSVTSRVAQLSVDGVPPVFNLPLVDQWVFPGQPLHWEVEAAGPRPLTYLWQFSTNGFLTTNLLQSGPMATFDLASAGYEHAGLWRVVARDETSGASASGTAKVVVAGRFYRLYALTNGLPEEAEAQVLGLSEGPAFVAGDPPPPARGGVAVGALLIEGTPRAYAFGPGGATALDPLVPGGASVARAINTHGDIVGSAAGPTGRNRAVRWRVIAMDHPFGAEGPPGTWEPPEDLDLPPDLTDPDVEAVALNDAGQVLANVVLESVPAREAWRWEHGRWQRMRNSDWASPQNAGWMHALSLSSLGHAVGYADGLDAAQFGHAWQYEPTNIPSTPTGELEVRDLHERWNFSPAHDYSRTTGINRWGHAVGWRRAARFTGTARAWLLARGQLVDLNLESGTALGHLKLNDAGEIVAQDFGVGPGLLSRPIIIRDDGIRLPGNGTTSTAEPVYNHHRRFFLEDLVLGGLGPFAVLDTVNAINQAGVITGTGQLSGLAGTRRPYLLVPTSVPGNQPPVAMDDTVTRYADQVMLSVSQRLLGNDSDPDPTDAPTLVTYDTRSIYGGTVVLQGDWLIYTASENFVEEDRFDYTITDHRGGMATASVFIRPEESRTLPALNQILTLQEPGTVPVLRFQGEPSEIYRIQASDDAQPGPWQTLAEQSTDADGLISILDSSTIFRSKRFYRAVRP